MKRAKKTGVLCENCGDETRFPRNSAGGRERLGWCVGCYRQASRQSSGGGHSGIWKAPAAENYKLGGGPGDWKGRYGNRR